ncbi:MAG: hypothetical protein ABL876_19070, partial [Chitinophagaceae bacterium]
MQVTSPVQGDVFSNEAIISYDATNLYSSNAIPDPVSLYYSDKIDDWERSIARAEDKTLIAKDQPSKGSFTWSITDLIPGVLYRAIVDSIDSAGGIREGVSDYFTVDYTAPEFTVRTDPPVTRRDDVSIIVDSTKELREPPVVLVTQKGATSVPVIMAGAGSHFEGIYAIQDGYDGVAHISIEGVDRAGNKGNIMTSGGSFAVNIDPPPKPSITYPLSSATLIGTTTVSGTVRSDTSVRLLVNGVDTFETRPNADGVFSFENIALSKEHTNGLNILSVSSVDSAGTLSEEALVNLKYNIDPSVSLVTPEIGARIVGRTSFEVLAKDENKDVLQFSYQLIPAAEYDKDLSATSTQNEWTTISDHVYASRYMWDSTEVEDGAYFIRAFAEDGTSRTYTSPARVTIHNVLPYFRFEDGRSTVVNTFSANIVGRAIAPD